MESAVPNIIVVPEKFQLVCGANEDCTIEITNVSFDAVLFRLLTTSPERYIVKHTKGVIRGNSSAKVSITLNRKHWAELDNKSAPVKDSFMLEYAALSSNDVVEPRASNVPDLIKKKKTADPSSVGKKSLRCHVLQNAADADQLSSLTGSTARGAAAGGDAASKNAAAADRLASALAANKAAEDTSKNINKEAGGALQTSSGKKKKMMMAAVAVLLAVIGFWLMHE